jgi:hypothetical protein
MFGTRQFRRAQDSKEGGERYDKTYREVWQIIQGFTSSTASKRLFALM